MSSFRVGRAHLQVPSYSKLFKFPLELDPKFPKIIVCSKIWINPPIIKFRKETENWPGILPWVFMNMWTRRFFASLLTPWSSHSSRNIHVVREFWSSSKINLSCQNTLTADGLVCRCGASCPRMPRYFGWRSMCFISSFVSFWLTNGSCPCFLYLYPRTEISYVQWTQQSVLHTIPDDGEGSNFESIVFL